MKKKSFSWLLVLALLVGCLPMAASAAEEKTLDLSGGSIVISQDKVVQNGTETPYTGAYRVTQSGGQCTNTIVVESGNIALTLDGVDIADNAANASLIEVKSGASLTLTLAGENKLTVTKPGNINAANGIYVPEGAELTIKGSGSLTINTYGGACIGVTSNKDKSGTIRIEGGTIDVTNRDGAAIGGGWGGAVGAIYISGGNITANGYGNTAAIGGGGVGNGSVDLIEISGGTVYAKANSVACVGIGATNAKMGTIRITGGNVTAITPQNYQYNMAIGCSSDNGVVGTLELLGGNITTEGPVGALNWDAAQNMTVQNVVWRGDEKSAESFEKVQSPTGVFFNGNEGTVYGDVKLTEDFTLSAEETLTIPAGSSLQANGHTLDILGKLETEGTLQLEPLALRLSAKANEPLAVGDTVTLTATLERPLAGAEVQFMVNGQALGAPVRVGDDGLTAQTTYLIRQDSTYTFSAKISYFGNDAESEKPVSLTVGASQTAQPTPQPTTVQSASPSASQTPAEGVKTSDDGVPLWILWVVLGVAVVGGGFVVYLKRK